VARRGAARGGRARHRHPGRGSVGPDGAAEECGRAGADLLHRLREPEGDLATNPRAALLLYWPPLGRQVRVEGAVARIDAAESDAYWATRPPGSRVSAAASPQSRVVADRAELEQRVAELRERHGDDPPRPAAWGGFRLEPAAWEFWQHRDDRLHDRLRYRRDGDAWVRERLAP
jgi:pyridoxamine 5'-phosphate oxidase